MSADGQAFKDAMANWSSGVTVVTTARETERSGITVSSFSGVSLDPPLVLVCIAKRLFTHQLIAQSGIYAVNVLGAEQVEIAKRFAGFYKEIKDRFAGIECRTEVTGAPVFQNALAWMDCRVFQAYDGGDHTIYVGDVLACGISSLRDEAAASLVYHKRTWGRFTPL
jgi:flavin reductase (DIM6/NTAB) family NADH-FMN oxidoreductase RutF